jgi:hypothetical protein
MKEKYPSITSEKCHELFVAADEKKSGKIEFGILSFFYRGNFS